MAMEGYSVENDEMDGMYNAATDYSISNGNPNGVWSYLTPEYLLTYSGTLPDLVTKYWSNGLMQPVWAGVLYSPILVGIGDNVHYFPGFVHLDPQTHSNVAVRFTAPLAGVYHISGEFRGDDADEEPHPVQVIENGAVVFSSNISTFNQLDPFSLTTKLDAGDKVDFAVDTGFTFVSLGTGLLVNIVNEDINPPCYVRGTLILTDKGEVSVERLAIGDIVVTASGQMKPIRWIGTRSYAGRFANTNPDVLPVCFKAGSLAENMPARDLWVSQKHAMFIDGVLIPAKHLVNDVSIVQADHVERVEYFHVELDSHDVIVAEGAPSESFVDDGGRGIFQNAHEFAVRYPNAEPFEARYCAPRVEDGFVLDAVRRRLAERAGLPVSQGDSAGELRGWLEWIEDGVVTGWAQSEGHPDAPVCLDIVVAGLVVIRVLAEQARCDLRQTGIGDGCHGFSVRLPATLSPPLPQLVSVRRSSDGAILPRLPHAVNDAAELTFEAMFG